MSGAVLPVLSYGASGGTALTILITDDVFIRSFLSDFMTSQQQTDWQAGVYSVMNIMAGGTAGAAVRRHDPGTTVVVSGGGSANIRGVVQ